MSAAQRKLENEASKVTMVSTVSAPMSYTHSEVAVKDSMEQSTGPHPAIARLTEFATLRRPPVATSVSKLGTKSTPS